MFGGLFIRLFFGMHKMLSVTRAQRDPEAQRKAILGVVGGLGPLASAEFVKTVYEHTVGEREQEASTVVLYSDPTFPDRTDEFLKGNQECLLKRLIGVMNRLCEAGASKIVICCVTMHYLLPSVPERLRERVISLVEVALAGVANRERPHLLICSNGTRQLGVFERHHLWESARNYVVMPEASDQERIHYELIYQMKRNCGLKDRAEALSQLLTRYGVDSFIAGCTEIHLLSKYFVAHKDHFPFSCTDPLTIIARGRTWEQL